MKRSSSIGIFFEENKNLFTSIIIINERQSTQLDTEFHRHLLSHHEMIEQFKTEAKSDRKKENERKEEDEERKTYRSDRMNSPIHRMRTRMCVCVCQAQIHRQINEISLF